MRQALEQARAALEPFAAVDPGDSPDDFALSMATPDITCGMIRALQSAKAAIDAALAKAEGEVVERVARGMAPLTQSERDALKMLAEQATKGAWAYADANPAFLEIFGASNAYEIGSCGFSLAVCPAGGEMDHSNAAFIAAFNPATALRLLAQLKAAEDALAEARGKALDEATQKCRKIFESIAQPIPLDGFDDGYTEGASDCAEAILALKAKP